MKLGDIGVLAEAIENSLPEIAKNNGGEDIRHRIKVSITVSEEELDGINRELYTMTNHKLPSDDIPFVETVDLDVVGIGFLISSAAREAAEDLV